MTCSMRMRAAATSVANASQLGAGIVADLSGRVDHSADGIGERLEVARSVRRVLAVG
jgi:hypothetical protein